MARITSSVGLISGIDTGTIINELLSLDSQPVKLLQNRITSANAEKQAYTALGTQLTQIQQIGQSLQLPTTFAASTATTSDNTIMTASAGTHAAVGSYSFDVASLVTSQQAISQGYASQDSLLGAGNITISLGGGEAGSETTLADLNGGKGVSQGQFRITDGSGNSAVIDTSKAVTLNDVVNQINNSLNVSVRASIKNDHLVLSDQSGQTKTNFSVTDLGNGKAAADLGIAGNTATTTITGTSINSISTSTPLSLLNDGRGVDSAGGASDFTVNLADGSSFQVTLGNAATIGDAISAINKAAGNKAVAALNTNTNSITLTDNSGGGGTLSVSQLNGSTAAQDLGLTGAAAGNTVGGKTLLTSLNSVLVSSLNGGSGLPLGTISITAGSGQPATIELSHATSVQDIIDSINNAGAGVTASLNTAGDGIALQNNTSSALTIADGSSTTATALGIAGTFAATQTTIAGANLHTQYVSNNTLLSSYNGGQGVDKGKFQITNSKGVSTTVDLSSGTFNRIGDVLAAINAKNIGVTASINQTGDGILLTDANNGPTKLQVTNLSGTAASDLGIATTATGNTIDGSQTKTIAVSNTDTLSTLQQKISKLGWGVSANIVNDGSGNNGYHLALTSLNSGLNGRFVIDGGATNLQTTNVVNAQNAAVFYGGTNGTGQSLLVTSSSNQLTNIVPGVTLQLAGTGNVTLNVTRDSSGLSNQLQTFTTTFNAIIQEVATLTTWNSTTNQAGLLLGDATVQDVQQRMYDVFDSVVHGAGQYKILSDMGLTINGDGSITYDANKFASAYAADPTSVQNLFTQASTGLATVLTKSMTQLVDPVTGQLTEQENTLTTQVQGFQTNINQLNALLAEQRTTLQNQFANMETVLSQLQSQGQALSSISSLTSSSTSSSSNKSSSSSSK